MNLQTVRTARASVVAVDAGGLLLRELIDYAGLFPPASLGMGAAVAGYDTYSRSEWNWMLGRFIVPVSRLAEFEEAFAGLPSSGDEGPMNWRLSALLGADPVADVDRLREFNGRMAGEGSRKALVDSVEVKVAGSEEITRLSGVVPAEVVAYFEIPWSIPVSSRTECIRALADSGRRAKIRMGGETADKFPASESVIEFINLCAAARVPFKATAGLHHPLRSVHRLTYEPESPSAMMHGFLNVFLAAAFLRAGMEAGVALRLLDEQSERAFQFDSDGVAWRQHRLGRQEIAAARRDFAISFGSCSFLEPIEDLRSFSLSFSQLFAPLVKIPAIKPER
jgi:hypothetical protein